MSFAISPATQGAATGYVSPSSIYALMRRIDSASATPLNLDVEEHVANATFKDAWRAWYRSWADFFHSYASPSASAQTKLSALFHSDEIAERTESFRRQLEDFYRTYPNELGPGGRPVPAARGVSPHVETLPRLDEGFPWWVWTLGIGALGAVGYARYRHTRKPKRRSRSR